MRARFGTICRAVLMLAINRSKETQFRNRISPDRLPTFLPISRTRFTVFILHRHGGKLGRPPRECVRAPPFLRHI